MSAYHQALAHIERHPGTGSALRLAKLLLSLWNGEDCGFSFRECIECLDDERKAIALRCVIRFAERGEDQELVAVGDRVYGLYRRQWELGVEARDAKAALRAKWDAEYEAKLKLEEEAAAEERERRRDCGDAAEWDSPGVRK